MFAVYKMTRESDTRIGLILLGVFLLAFAVAFALFFFLVPGGWVLDVMIVSLIWSACWRCSSSSAAVRSARSTPRSRVSRAPRPPCSAAAEGWKVEPAIAFNRQQDLVHRVVGPPGIVLIGEGNPPGSRSLLATEHRKHPRVASETPIHEVVCGDSEGAVPVPKLTTHVSKLGRRHRAGRDDRRAPAAQGARRQPPRRLPIPKGPVPTSMKGSRQNMAAARPPLGRPRPEPLMAWRLGANAR